MGKAQVIVDSKHFVRIQHYRLKKRGKLNKKISFETIYHKSMKSIRKLVKVVKGQLIQKCVRKMNSSKADNDSNGYDCQEKQLVLLKSIDHVIVAQLLLNELFVQILRASSDEHDLSFIEPVPCELEESVQYFRGILTNNKSNNSAGLSKLKAQLDEVEKQLDEHIFNLEMEQQTNQAPTASRFKGSKSGVTKALFVESLAQEGEGNVTAYEDDDDDDDDDGSNADGDDNDDDGDLISRSSCKDQNTPSAAETYQSKVKNRLKNLRSSNRKSGKAKLRSRADDGLAKYRPNPSISNNAPIEDTTFRRLQLDKKVQRFSKAQQNVEASHSVKTTKIPSVKGTNKDESLHPSWAAAKEKKANKTGLIRIDMSSDNNASKKIKFDE